MQPLSKSAGFVMALGNEDVVKGLAPIRDPLSRRLLGVIVTQGKL